MTFQGVPIDETFPCEPPSTREEDSVDGRVWEFKSHEVGVQIPRGFHPETPAQVAVRGIAPASWGGVASLHHKERAALKKAISCRIVAIGAMLMIGIIWMLNMVIHVHLLLGGGRSAVAIYLSKADIDISEVFPAV